MPNIAQILKNEILRLSRKEVKTATEHLTDTLKELKHQNALLKKEIAGLKEQLASVTDSGRPDTKASAGAQLREKRKWRSCWKSIPIPFFYGNREKTNRVPPPETGLSNCVPGPKARSPHCSRKKQLFQGISPIRKKSRKRLRRNNLCS